MPRGAFFVYTILLFWSPETAQAFWGVEQTGAVNTVIESGKSEPVDLHLIKLQTLINVTEGILVGITVLTIITAVEWYKRRFSEAVAKQSRRPVV